MTFFIHVTPNAKSEKVERIDESHLKVWVKEPPREGRANAAVIKALADYFGVAPSRINILSGFTARNKTIELQ